MGDPKLTATLENSPDNFLSRIAALERMVEELQSGSSQSFEENNQGRTIIFDLALAPAEGVEVTDPTDVGFTGVFIDGEGIIFNGESWNFGGVAAGVLQVGIKQIDGKLYAAGGNVVIDVTGIHLTNGADLTVNQWFGLGLPSDSTSAYVYAIAIDSINNCVYIGGEFVRIGGIPAVCIAKYNLTTKEWSSIGGQLGASVTALAVSGDNLFVGGNFQNADGLATADYIAKYTISTGVWSSIGGQLNQAVDALAVSGDKLFVGGLFSNADGIATADKIALYTISTGIWSSIGGQLNDSVFALAISGDNLFVGGAFTDADGLATADYIAKYTISTGVWSSIGGQLSSYVYTLAVSGDNLFVGGNFQNADGIATADYIAKYTISTGVWSSIGGQLNGKVRAFAFSGNNLFVGGVFSTVNGSSSRMIAVYISTLKDALEQLNRYYVPIRADGSVLIDGPLTTTNTPKVLYANNLGATISTVGQTTAFSVTLPGSLFAAGGSQVRFKLSGYVDTNANARNLTARFTVGATTRTIISALLANKLYSFTYEGTISRNAANVQNMWLEEKIALNTAAGEAWLEYNAPAETEANPIVVTFTLQLSGSVNAGFFSGVRVEQIKDI